MIALRDLSVAMGDFRLNGITLEAGEGDYFVLLGPSGAGKTVLLELIAGLRRPDSGEVVLNGTNMSWVPPERRHTALVYQDYSLFPHMTAAENIAFGLKMQKRSSKEIQERVDNLLADFMISSLKDRYPGSLSGGEQQRVAIARALATNPSVLLLDEPFASLDPRSRNECIKVVQDLKNTRSITIIQVSHSHDEAYALADKVVVLLGGTVVQSGTPDEIFCHPVSVDVARFVGMENILTGTIVTSESGHSRISIGSAMVWIPGVFQQGTRMSIGIPSGCIKLVSERPISDNSEMNSIAGYVTSVTLGKETAIIRLEGEISLTAVIRRTPDSGYIPLEDTLVYAVFKGSDMQVYSGA
jgi:molybdate/tungstate transport system ATP-binding protein